MDDLNRHLEWQWNIQNCKRKKWKLPPWIAIKYSNKRWKKSKWSPWMAILDSSDHLVELPPRQTLRHPTMASDVFWMIEMLTKSCRAMYPDQIVQHHHCDVLQEIWTRHLVNSGQWSVYCVYRENVAADKIDDANTSHLVGKMEIMRKVTFMIVICYVCEHANNHKQVDQDIVEKNFYQKFLHLERIRRLDTASTWSP